MRAIRCRIPSTARSATSLWAVPASTCWIRELGTRDQAPECGFEITAGVDVGFGQDVERKSHLPFHGADILFVSNGAKSPGRLFLHYLLADDLLAFGKVPLRGLDQPAAEKQRGLTSGGVIDAEIYLFELRRLDAERGGEGAGGQARARQGLGYRSRLIVGGAVFQMLE